MAGRQVCEAARRGRTPLPATCRSPLTFFSNRDSKRGRGKPGAPGPRAAGQYLTDGSGLFRVVHAIRDPGGRTVLLELEDCRTLQLILCDVDTASRGPLQPVTPASFASDDAALERLAEHPGHNICSRGAPAPPFAGLHTG